MFIRNGIVACRFSTSKQFISTTRFMQSMANHDIGITIHMKIPTIFQNKNMREMERKLSEMIATEGRNLDISHLASIIHQAAKVNFTIELSSITKLLVQRKNENMSMIDIGKMLYGLQRFWGDQEQHVLQLIDIITPKVKALATVNPQTCASALSGLQNLSSSHRAVRALLRALAQKIELCNETWKAQEIGISLSGLRNMSSDDEEVLMLLAALTPKIESCPEELLPVNIVGVMKGLRFISTKKMEVRLLLTALIPKIASCQKSFTALQISVILYGKQ